MSSSSSSNLQTAAAALCGEGDKLPDEGITLTQIILAIVIITIMLGVGMAVDKTLFKHIVVTKKAIFACIQGVCQQFILMPLVALAMAGIFWDQDDPLWKYTAVGFIFLGIVPGGTTSNAITTMANGILELSIFMTICSTAIGFGMTPLWLYLLTMAIGIESSSMDFGSLGLSFVLLLIPLILGALISYCCPKVKIHVEKVIGVLTVLFVIIAIVFVCIENAESLRVADWRVHVPACFFFLISSSLGYFLSANLFGNAPAVNRTIFLEVGLQNTVLVYALIELTLPYRCQRIKAIPFPLLYTIWMFFWSGVFGVLFRQYKNYNDANGIADNDPDLDAMVSGMKAELAAANDEGAPSQDKELEEGGAATSSGEPVSTEEEKKDEAASGEEKKDEAVSEEKKDDEATPEEEKKDDGKVADPEDVSVVVASE